MPSRITRPDRLSDAQHRAVLALVADREVRDGAPPLSDQALSRLGDADVAHLLLTTNDFADGGSSSDALAGYAQLDGDSAEVAGDADAVAALVDQLEAGGDRRDQSLIIWSHGRRSPVGDVLSARGYDAVRILHRLERPLVEPPPAPDLPAGVTVRTFRTGHDEDAWLELNAAAFAGHAEQGRWTRRDIEARKAEAWFDPQGFLLAERDGTLIAFHWTKVHPGGEPGRVGEVYVLGVAPAAQGLGLGATLLARGLQVLADRGCTSVLLYVDDDNAGALRLYERAGFERADSDTQWRRPSR